MSNNQLHLPSPEDVQAAVEATLHTLQTAAPILIQGLPLAAGIVRAFQGALQLAAPPPPDPSDWKAQLAVVSRQTRQAMATLLQISGKLEHLEKLAEDAAAKPA